MEMGEKLSLLFMGKGTIKRRSWGGRGREDKEAARWMGNGLQWSNGGLWTCGELWGRSVVKGKCLM